MAWRSIRSVATSRLAYPVVQRLVGRDVHAKLAQLNAAWTLPTAERRRQAGLALADMVAWAGSAVPYYRDLFARLRFDPEKLQRDTAYLSELPYLTKEIIRAEGNRLLREDYANLAIYRSRTGGSTGPSTEICYDQAAADWSSAITRHARLSIGKRDGLTELHLASRFPEVFPLKDRLKEVAKCFVMNRSNAFITDFEPSSLDLLWRQIEQDKPYLVHGHPSTLYHLARHVAARAGTGRVFAVFESSGELLQAYQRETIARVFACRVVDRYGLAEFGVVAYQMDGDSGALRVYDGFVWPETTEDGEIVFTGLDEPDDAAYPLSNRRSRHADGRPEWARALQSGRTGARLGLDRWQELRDTLSPGPSATHRRHRRIPDSALPKANPAVGPGAGSGSGGCSQSAGRMVGCHHSSRVHRARGAEVERRARQVPPCPIGQNAVRPVP